MSPRVFSTHNQLSLAARSPGSAPIEQVRIAHEPKTRREVYHVNLSPSPPKRRRQGVQAAVLGQDSICLRRFRSEISDSNLGFRGEGVTLVLGKLGGGAGQR